MIPLRVTYDEEADAAYIYFQDAPEPPRKTEKLWPAGPFSKELPLLAETLVIEQDSILLDIDQKGRIWGIEILGAARLLPPQLLAQADRG